MRNSPRAKAASHSKRTSAPGALSPEAERALNEEAQRVIRLQLSFGFDWWPDVVNVAMRALHAGAGAAYFALMAPVFAMAWLGDPSAPTRLHAWLARWFLPAAGASLALLFAAGVYSGFFGAPIAAPGVFDFARMRSIPYGEWYLAAFASKVVLFIGLGVLTHRTHAALQSQPSTDGAPATPADVWRLKRISILTMGVGSVLVVNVAVLVYLHYLSHLAVFLPEG